MSKLAISIWDVCKQAVKVNDNPIPFLKAFLASLAASLPVLCGLLLGNFHNGLIAGLGGFAYLYVFRAPHGS